ncbi:hypothetical protein Leryth_013734, partial [Lithospermum erythrorhizon]
MKRTLITKVLMRKYYGAYKFYRDSELFCHSKGEIILVESILPDYIVWLITSTDTQAKNFQNMIRTYNNHFAFTSIGISCDENYEHKDHDIYTVRVHGHIYLFEYNSCNVSIKGSLIYCNRQVILLI